jgi:hypothetical protein
VLLELIELLEALNETLVFNCELLDELELLEIANTT